MLVGDVGPLGDRPAHQRTGSVEMRLGPVELVGGEGVAHHELQGRVALPPVPPGGAAVALGVVALGLLRCRERRSHGKDLAPFTRPLVAARCGSTVPPWQRTGSRGRGSGCSCTGITAASGAWSCRGL